ncbi:hypothetical protein P886_0799 [Alteromonadaceae bacterium 2753L.S.0a.02]|nr:hypothetical protein P886_0799 [Alteromonadaceae bacterium 2753L.S.0a.02]
MCAESRKPERRVAMQALLAEISRQLPLDAPAASLCQNTCMGCPKKLMQYLEGEVDFWQDELGAGETPSFGDIQKLAKSARKIHRVLQQNGLIDNATTQ